MVRKRRKKILKYGVSGFIVILIVLIGTIVIFIRKPRGESVSASNQAVPKIQDDLIKETVIEEKMTKDLRLHYYNCVQLNSRLKSGSYVDIRISFANGLDFIILPKKKIITRSLNEKEIWLYVSEEEILRMSSAAVDNRMQQGSCIYAVEYAKDTQEAAKADYPVNSYVRSLIDGLPNVISKDDTLKETKFRRKIEESGQNVTDYYSESEPWNADQSDISRAKENIETENYYENEEVTYLD